MSVSGAGSVRQRHTRRCPRPADGSSGYAEHKCRGPWFWVLDVGADPQTGKRVQRTQGGYARKGEAEEALREARSRLSVTGGRSEQMTVSEWLAAWLKSMHTASEATVARYESLIRLHIDPLLGSRRLTALVPEDIDRLLSAVSAVDYAPSGRGGNRYRDKRGLSSASVNRIYDCLRSALSVAVKRRLIAWNPAAVVAPPSERNEPGRAWSPAQAAQFLDAHRAHRLYAAWHLVLVAGARRGEIAGARWQAFDLDRGIWWLETARIQVGGSILEKSPKSAAGTRRVYLDDETINVLRTHRRAQAKDRLAAGPAWRETGYVFASSVGAPLSPGTFTTSWRAACLRAALPVIRLHDGRHTAVTVASEHAGVTDQVLIERVGHSTAAVNRRYRHVNEELHRAAAEAVAATYRAHRRA